MGKQSQPPAQYGQQRPGMSADQWAASQPKPQGGQGFFQSLFAPAPMAPDYYGAASAQGNAAQANVNAQTTANRPNINTPFGFQGWTQDANGNWTMTAGLSPDVQAAYSQMRPFDLGAFGAAPQAVRAPQFGDIGTGEQAREQAISSAYDAAAARLNPRFQQAQGALDAKLANQGLDPNSAAARNAQAQLGAQRNDAFGGAMANAINQGTAAGNSIFGNNLAGAQARFGADLAGQQAQFGTGMQARQQAIAEALRARGMPLQDLQSLMGFTATPDFAKAGQAQTPDFLGAATAAGNYGMAGWQGQNQWNADVIGGIMELLKAGGSAAAMASDERLKANIVRTGFDVLPGVPLASYEYLEEPGVRRWGVIAQDLEKHRPELVEYRADGMRLVNYAGLLEAAHG